MNATPHRYALRLACLLLAAAPFARATNFTWGTTTTSNSWANQANWSTGTLPTTSDDTAVFGTLDTTADTAVMLDGHRSINKLIFGDADPSTAAGWLFYTGSVAGATLTLGGASPTITVGNLSPGKTAALNVALAGTNGLTLNSSGSNSAVTLGVLGTYTGDTILQTNATLNLFGGNYLGASTNLVFQGGTLFGGNSSSFTINNVICNAGQTGNIFFGNSSNYRMSLRGTWTGGGTLNCYQYSTVARDDYSGNYSGFTGTVNLYGPGQGRLLINGGAFIGWPNADVVHNAAYLGAYDNSTGNTFTIGSLAGTNPASILTLNANGAPTYVIGGNHRSTTFAGSIQSSSIVVKNGTGTWTLSGNHTYTGATTVNTGAVVLVTGRGAISNSVVTVATNASFGVQLGTAGGASTITGLVARAGSSLALYYGTVAPSVTTAPLQIRNTIAATNPVTINVLGGSGWVPGVYPLVKFPGGFAAGSAFAALALGTLPLRVQGVLSNDTANGQIDLVVTAVNQPLKWALGDGYWNVNTSSNWTDAVGNVVAYQEQSGVGDQTLFSDEAAGSPAITVTLTNTVSPATLTVSNATKSYTFGGAGGIAGPVGLAKQGSALLTLATANTFTGPVGLDGGTVNFTTAANLGAGTALNFGGGTLQYAAGNTTDLSTRTVTLNAGGATIDTGNNHVAFNNRIGNHGAGGLTKAGAGSLTLATNGTYFGHTTLAQGSLVLGPSASLSNSAALLVGAGTTFDVSASSGLILNGLIGQILAGSGVVTGSVTVAAGSVLTPATNGVAGTITFTNDLTLDGGTLNLDVSRSSAASDLVRVGGVLSLNGGTITISVSGAALTNGTYRLIQYTGSYNYGLYNILLSGIAQPGQIAVLDDSTSGAIDLVVIAASSSSLVWAGDGAQNFWGSSFYNDWYLNGLPPLAPFANGDLVAFNDLGASNSPVAIIENVFPGSVTVTATNDYTFAGAGKIAGASGLAKSGAGKLTVLNPNTFTGPILVDAGMLLVGDGMTYGATVGSGNISNNAALVFNQPDDFTLKGAISGPGSLTKQGGGALTLLGNCSYTGPTLVDLGTLQVGSGGVFGALGATPVTLTNGGTFSHNRAGTRTFNNGIGGDGTFKKLGASTLTLGGVNTYLQNTYVSDGTLKLSASGAIPSGGLTTGWLILDGGTTGGTLDLNGFNQTVNALSGLTGAVLGQILNNGTGLSTLTVGTPATTTYAGLILDHNNAGGGAVGLVVNGDGTLNTTLTLSGANNYSGPVLINGAKVILASANSQLAIGTGLVTLTNGGTLQMNYYGSGANTQGAFVNPVLVPAGTTGSLFTLGRGAYAGNITVHGTLNLTTSYIRSQPTGDWSASDGQINIAAGTGGGDLYYNTAANISYGTAAVDLGAGARIYNAGNTGTAGNTFTIGELTGFGTITDSSSGGGTNRITTYLVGGRNSSATFSGTIANLARQTAINKVGTGSWTLNGTDTYTGPTTVSGGVLVVSPSSYMANCTNITVAAGALFDVSQFNGLIMTAGQTLAGSGVVTGSVAMVASDVLAPGGGVAGTLSFSNSLALTGEVTHAFDLSKSPLGSNDLVVVQGDLGLANTNSLLLNALNGYLTSGVYPLIRYHGNVTNETGAVVPVGVLTSLKPVGLWATQSHATLIVSNAPGQIVLVVDVGTGTSLTWAGDGYTNTWDLTVSTNWLQAATPVAFFQYDRVTFGDPTTNTAVSVVGTLAPTAVTVNSASNYTFSGSGKLTGLTGLTKTGNGTLTVGNTGGNDYAGPVTIPAGVLKAGVATALGATNGATLITNTGALDVGGLSLANEPIIVSGSGSGTGAILNSGAAQLSALQCVTLAGDTTFGGTNRWDIRTNALGAYLHGNGHNLTKTSSNDIYFVSLGATDLGDIAVQQGRIGVQDTTLLGAGGTLRLSAGAGLDLWNNSVTNTKAVSLTNATLSSSSGTNAYGGPIDLNGTGTFTATTPLVLSGALGGTGGLLKNGASPLTLTGTNTYTGTTTVSVATLALAGTGSIGRSAVIDVAAAAALDVSGLAGGWVTLGSGQTLMGSGSVRGSVIAPVGATVAPGEAIGTLTVTNTVTLAGNTLMELNTTNPQSSDRLTATNIGYGGTLTLTNLGPALAAGNAFKLFSGAYSGAFATINPPTPGPGLAWFNTLGSDGTLAVVSATPPTILPVYLVGTNLALRIETVVGKNYVLEGTPGLEGTPVWTPVGTNAGTGLVSTNLVPVNSTGGRGFFRYQVQ